jgi:hypothetical protein
MGAISVSPSLGEAKIESSESLPILRQNFHSRGYAQQSMESLLRRRHSKSVACVKHRRGPAQACEVSFGNGIAGRDTDLGEGSLQAVEVDFEFCRSL